MTATPSLAQLRALPVHQAARQGRCLWCYRPLTFVRGLGWVHAGGSRIVQRCRECGTLNDGPQRFTCARCGSTDVVDDHCALADLS